MTHDEIKYDLLKTELELTQRQMDKYDQLSATTKTWTVTLWAASVGWAFQLKRSDVLLISLVIIGIFWLLDALNKTFRQDYKKRRDEVAAALEHLFKTNSLAPNASSPKLPSHSRRAVLGNFFAAHVALPYVLLAAISLMLAAKFQ